MNRPRESVLTLFDPLMAVVGDQPQIDFDVESEPDKENSQPNDISIFLSRKPAASLPATLKRRLIDVGEVTVDEVALDAIEESANESDVENTEGATKSLVLPSPRTPLQDISLDELSPIRKRRRLPSAEQVPAITLPIVRESSLDSIINAVQASGLTFAEREKLAPTHEPTDQNSSHISASLTIPSSNVFSSGNPHQSKSTSSQSDNIHHENSKSTADFLSSFYMHMQATEANTFDLIHGDISFAPENWKIDEEEDQVVPPFTNDHVSSLPPCPKFGFGTPFLTAITAKQQTPETPSPSIPQSLQLNEADKPVTIHISTPAKVASEPVCESTEKNEQEALPVIELAKPTRTPTRATPGVNTSPNQMATVQPKTPAANSPSIATRKSALPILTPPPSKLTTAAPVPPPVHALRIVKRPRHLEEKPSSGSVRPASESVQRGTTTARSTRLGPMAPCQTSRITSGASTASSREPQRPPVRVASTTTTSRQTVAPKLGVPITSGSGPRRVLLTDPSAPAAGVDPRAKPPVPGAQPLARGLATKVTPAVKPAGTASGLPRPASRIPPPSKISAPSGIARPKLAAASVTQAAVGRGVPRRAAK